MKNIFGEINKIRFSNIILRFLFRQFGDANPNSIEASYYERTVNATYMYGADHIDGDHHVYSLFYGVSNVPVVNSRM